MSDAQFVCAVILVMVAIYWGAYSVWYALASVGGSDAHDGYSDPARPRVVAQAPHAERQKALHVVAGLGHSKPIVSASERAGTTTLTLSQE